MIIVPLKDLKLHKLRLSATTEGEWFQYLLQMFSDYSCHLSYTFLSASSVYGKYYIVWSITSYILFFYWIFYWIRKWSYLLLLMSSVSNFPHSLLALSKTHFVLVGFYLWKIVVLIANTKPIYYEKTIQIFNWCLKRCYSYKKSNLVFFLETMQTLVVHKHRRCSQGLSYSAHAFGWWNCLWCGNGKPWFASQCLHMVKLLI